MAANNQRLFLSDQDICPVYQNPPERFGLHNEYSSDGDNRYTPKTLIAKWYEERNGIDEIKKIKPLPTQYEYAYRTIYGDSYNKEEKQQRFFEREPHVYPTHQPELDPPHTKTIPKSCYMLDYVDPALLLNPPTSTDSNTVEKEHLQYCGPPAPSGTDETAEKYQLCGSYIPLKLCSLTDSEAMKSRQLEVPGFCGYYIPTKGPLGKCTAEFCEPCKPTIAPSGPGLAACCGSYIP
ncbi:UPF0686 protein C11orf1 homolog [Heterodontus francisci]|uniref:UPF0686 protein C11orf1 homolog n=1 Tax=Heterodontus francisci TaxID=7792 RepID=UPI00355C4DC0